MVVVFVPECVNETVYFDDFKKSDTKNKISVLWNALIKRKSLTGGSGHGDTYKWYFLVDKFYFFEYQAWYKRFVFKPNKKKIDDYIKKCSKECRYDISLIGKKPFVALLFKHECWKSIYYTLEDCIYIYSLTKVLNIFDEDEYDYDLIPLVPNHYIDRKLCETTYNIFGPTEEDA